MRMSVSILTPKAFSMRRAMSPERSALPLSRLESVGRETRRAAAAAYRSGAGNAPRRDPGLPTETEVTRVGSRHFALPPTISTPASEGGSLWSWCNVIVGGIPQMARRPKNELVVRTSEALASGASTFLWNHCCKGTGTQ